MNKFRNTTKWFIAFQLLDMSSTLLGLSFGLGEANPLGITMSKLFVCKIFVTIMLSIILQIKTPKKTDWIVVVVSGLVIPWNLFLIFVYSVILNTPQIPLDFLIAEW